MGIPYVDAPTEAEARKSALFVCDYHILFHLECAALVKEGKVYGIGTEDMDVSEIFIFLLSSQSYFVGIDIWFRCTYTSFNI
jgi:hypothetical protein